MKSCLGRKIKCLEPFCSSSYHAVLEFWWGQWAWRAHWCHTCSLRGCGKGIPSLQPGWRRRSAVNALALECSLSARSYCQPESKPLKSTPLLHPAVSADNQETLTIIPVSQFTDLNRWLITTVFKVLTSAVKLIWWGGSELCGTESEIKIECVGFLVFLSLFASNGFHPEIKPIHQKALHYFTQQCQLAIEKCLHQTAPLSLCA